MSAPVVPAPAPPAVGVDRPGLAGTAGEQPDGSGTGGSPVPAAQGSGLVRPLERLAVLLAAVVLAAVALHHAADAAETSRVFRGHPFNGAFQLLNPLRRLEAGQVPGEDFVFFHGIAVPLVHYPVYALAGADLFAAELARRLVSPAAFLLGLFAVMLAGTRRAGAAVVLTGVVAGTWSVTQLDEALIAPHNSLLGLRSSGVLLVAALLLLPAGTAAASAPGTRPALLRWSPRRRDLLVGAGCAVAFLLGSEAGLALVPGVAVAYLLVPTGSWRSRATALARVALGGAVALAGLLLLATRGSVPGAVALLEYALVAVPGDQFWYFGAPPNHYVTDVADLVDDPRLPVTLGLLAVALLITALLLGRRLLPLDAGRGLVALGVTAAVSTFSYLGIEDARYLQPAQRALLVLAALAAYHVVRRLSAPAEAQASPAASDGRPRVAAFALVTGLLLISALVVVPQAAGAPGRLAAAWSSPPQLGPDWQAVSRTAEQVLGTQRCGSPDESLLWSTYSDLVEEQRGCFHPDTDYVIHALGAERRREYLERFAQARPPVVQTARRGSFAFEDWLRYTSWPWYEALLARYEPAAQTGHSVFWRRLPEEAPARLRLGPPQSVVPPPGAEEVVLPSVPGSGLLVVEVAYRVDNPAAALPVVGDLSRFLVEVSGTRAQSQFAVDPARGTIRFPVLPRADGEPVRLRFGTAGPVPGASWSPRAVEVRAAQVPADTLAALLS